MLNSNSYATHIDAEIVTVPRWRRALESASLPRDGFFVQRVDHGAPPLFDHPPLHLHRWRELTAGDREFGWEQSESLDRLERRKPEVDSVNSALKQVDDVSPDDECFVCPARPAQICQRVRQYRKVGHEERGCELPAIADQYGLSEERAAP